MEIDLWVWGTNEETDRAIRAMRRGTPDDIEQTTLFDVRLGSLTDEQCRVAAYWLAGEVGRWIELSRSTRDIVNSKNA